MLLQFILWVWWEPRKKKKKSSSNKLIIGRESCDGTQKKKPTGISIRHPWCFFCSPFHSFRWEKTFWRPPCPSGRPYSSRHLSDLWKKEPTQRVVMQPPHVVPESCYIWVLVLKCVIFPSVAAPRREHKGPSLVLLSLSVHWPAVTDRPPQKARGLLRVRTW